MISTLTIQLSGKIFTLKWKILSILQSRTGCRIVCFRDVFFATLKRCFGPKSCQLFLKRKFTLENVIISGLGIRSFVHRSLAHFKQNKWATVSKATVSESLRSLISKEQPWANRSGRSLQMSDHEQFAQVAHQKWANERFAQQFLAKKSKILFFSMFYIHLLF